jgi:peptide/nickel transport system permease protein
MAVAAATGRAMPTKVQPSLAARVLRRFLRRRIAAAGLFIAAAITVIGLLAPVVAPYSPTEPVGDINGTPSAQHWLGTDRLGRDLLSRLIYGARISLLIGVTAQAISVVLGTALGMAAGYFGRGIDIALMRFVDVLMAFPFILVAILVVAAVGPSTMNVILAIGLTSWTATARIIRAEVLRVREQEFVTAARAIGASTQRVLGRHVFPSLISVSVTLGTLGLGTAILAEASLSFLGLGIQPPTPSWGLELSYGQITIFSAPYQTIAPSIAIFLTVLAFNLLGDGLRDALDPRDATLRTM